MLFSSDDALIISTLQVTVSSESANLNVNVPSKRPGVLLTDGVDNNGSQVRIELPQCLGDYR
jgi:hypothetical protein